MANGWWCTRYGIVGALTVEREIFSGCCIAANISSITFARGNISHPQFPDHTLYFIKNRCII